MTLAVEHPYYCQEGCFYSNGCHEEFASWAKFIAEWGDADEDYNLLYRWDWMIDEEDGSVRLELRYMLQRKAAPRSVTVIVRPEDEPAVLEWLRPKWAHIQRLWAPLSNMPDTGERQ